MPTYAWTCHACHASNVPGTDVCARCGCPANASARDIEFFKTGASSSQETKTETPPTPAMAIGFILFGGVLLFGAFYQVVRGKWFPLFPIQIDGIFGMFKDAFGLNAGIYASSLLAGALGLALLWLGAAVLRNQRG